MEEDKTVSIECRSNGITVSLDRVINGELFYSDCLVVHKIVRSDRGDEIRFVSDDVDVIRDSFFIPLSRRYSEGGVIYRDVELVNIIIDERGSPTYERTGKIFAVEDPSGEKVEYTGWRVSSVIDSIRKSDPESVERIESLRRGTRCSVPEDYGVWAIAIDMLTYKKEMVWITDVEFLVLDGIQEIWTITLVTNETGRARRIFAAKEVRVLNYEGGLDLEGKEIYILQGQSVIID